MEMLLQFIAVQIILPVEIACGNFFRAENIIQLGKANGAEYFLKHLICAYSAAFATTNIVNVSPE